MKKSVTMVLLTLSFSVFGEGKNDASNYNANSYGSPKLYYSHESIQERKKLDLLKKSNDIYREHLELEKSHIRDEYRRERKRPIDDE